MNDQKAESELKTLYQITGNAADINTILINRGEFRYLRARVAELEAQLESIGAGGVGPMIPRKLTQQDIADSALLGNIESPLNACMHQEHCKRWKAQADQQHQRKLRNDNDLQRENGQLITSSSVPAGWKLVPVEPNLEMLKGAFPASGPVTANAVYRAMLAAAPSAPAENSLTCRNALHLQLSS